MNRRTRDSGRRRSPEIDGIHFPKVFYSAKYPLTSSSKCVALDVHTRITPFELPEESPHSMSTRVDTVIGSTLENRYRYRR
jgi:hypothetical protein